MKIKLEFFTKDGSPCLPSPPPFPIPSLQDGGKISEHEIKNNIGELREFDDLSLVSAQLVDDHNQPVTRLQDTDLFRLQLRGDPDYVSHADINGKFYAEVKENGKKIRITSVKLLRGAAGWSYLLLQERASAAPKYDFKDIASFRLKIRPPLFKAKAMACMVDELIAFEPDTALSHRGLSQSNIHPNWESGGGSPELSEIRLKLTEMEHLLRDLWPYLNAIRGNCAHGMVRNRELHPVEKTRQYGPGFEKEVLRNVHKGRYRTIRAWVPRQTYELPIHCAIKDFLIRFKEDASKETAKIHPEIARLQQEILSPHPDIPFVGEVSIETKQSEIKEYEELGTRFTRLRNQSNELLSDFYPWAQCNRREITTLSIGEVPDSFAYKHVYLHVLKYRNRRFFKESLEGRFDVPHYVRDGDTPSTWQKKYSTIYEEWVFFKMLEAFQKEGFTGLLDGARRAIREKIRKGRFDRIVNEPIQAVFANGELELSIYHGIVAYSPKYKPKPGTPLDNSPFELISNSSSRQSTPDFALVFSCKSTGEVYWINMDAKSDDELYTPKTYQRVVNYRDVKLRQIGWRGSLQLPGQCWLIYSGRFGSVASPHPAGIEFEEADILQEVDPLNAGLASLAFATNVSFGLKWKGRKGVIGLKQSSKWAVGHIRANILDSGVEAIFQEFACGQIATARRQLGLSKR